MHIENWKKREKNTVQHQDIRLSVRKEMREEATKRTPKKYSCS